MVIVQCMAGPGPTMVVVYATVLLAGISSYIGALWTLESSLWNRSLPETMLVLGNNGRYATAIILPLTLLRWIEPSNPSSEEGGPEHRNRCCCLGPTDVVHCAVRPATLVG